MLVKLGEYIVVVEHVLDVFSSSATIEFKNLRIYSNIGICMFAR